jgi:hypothetical protein
MSKQKTIGTNPLAAYLSSDIIAPQPQDQSSEKISVSLKKQRITIHISAEIIERVKNAVFWEPGLTLAGFAEYALEQAINQMELEKGSVFPPRRHPLKGGRPLK